MSDFGRRALVIGAGRSGLAAARALRARGTGVTVVDAKERAALGEAAAEIDGMGARLIGENAVDDVAAAVDIAVLSPGVPPWARPVLAARGRGVPVIGEIELAYRVARGPIAAITGTKGKSTTTALVGHVLRAAGIPAVVAGNIGTPLVTAADAAPAGAWLIAEVSSFQLESIVEFRPRIAALLNLSADHLDRYPDVATYAAAKRRIFERQHTDDVVIANADDARVRALVEGARAQQRWFGTDGRCDVRVHGDELFAGDRPLGAPPLLGAHNLANAAAAALVALAAGVPADEIAGAWRSFAPLHHRLEPVHDAGGVLWVDDSKATNPAAAIAALHAFERPLVVIAGGKSKNADFTAFAAALGRRAKHVVLIGECAGEIAALLPAGAPPRTLAATFDKAIAAARAAARPGDVVLLAPGCASFDMFADAEQRGERFAALAVGEATVR